MNTAEIPYIYICNHVVFILSFKDKKDQISQRRKSISQYLQVEKENAACKFVFYFFHGLRF